MHRWKEAGNACRTQALPPPLCFLYFVIMLSSGLEIDRGWLSSLRDGNVLLPILFFPKVSHPSSHSPHLSVLQFTAQSHCVTFTSLLSHIGEAIVMLQKKPTKDSSRNNGLRESSLWQRKYLCCHREREYQPGLVKRQDKVPQLLEYHE